MTLEVFLLLLEDFVFPGPEGLQAEGFTLGVSLVLFEDLDGVFLGDPDEQEEKDEASERAQVN